MSEISRENPEEQFHGWVLFEMGKWWPNPDTMPQGAEMAYQNWRHHTFNLHDTDGSMARREAERFSQLTGGCKPEDFTKYINEKPHPGQK